MEANDKLKRVALGAAVAAMVCSALVWATAGSGTSSTLVGQAIYDAFKVKRESADGWEVEVEAKQGLKIATQTIVFQPGGHSGWHSHPGPVFISVKEGTMTFYDENCNATVVMAGQGFLDEADHAHLARNESGAPATNVVTYFVPPNATSLRIDAPQPSTCSL